MGSKMRLNNILYQYVGFFRISVNIGFPGLEMGRKHF